MSNLGTLSPPDAAPTAEKPPPAPARRAFTLVELLLVIAIIALLISIAVPALDRTRSLARKAVCATTLHAHGTHLAQYIGTYRSYPLYGASYTSVDGWPYYGHAWSKFYGVMEAAGVRGTKKNNWGGQAYLQERDEIWAGALCPSMDADAIWDWLEGAPAVSYPNPGKAYNHRNAIGWQWNSCLRGQTPNAPWRHCNYGRWSSNLELCRYYQDAHSNEHQVISTWIDYLMYPPGTYADGLWLAAQAVSPAEVANPALVAEAWDSCDLETAPNAVFGPNWVMENLQAGWHVGPYNRATNGWALLNAVRHDGSPNILYADGSVVADATRRIDPTELEACPDGNWKGLNVVSWPDYKEDWGTLHHILPQTAYYSD